MNKYILIFLIIILNSIQSFSTVYEVGPGKTYVNISDVPLESLAAGDTLRIYYRDTPYKEKFVLGAAGTPSKPVVVDGVPSPSSGLLPIIDGDGATTRNKLNFWNEVRGVIKVGGTNTPSDNASYIIIQNLEIKNARPGFFFTDFKGSKQQYIENATTIFIENGQHITVRNCKLHDCGNGLFVSYQSSEILIENNEIYNNGIDGSVYEHNTYTEAAGITYQFNHFGPLRSNCLGNNLKDRSAGTVIRYNTIVGGNRQLDLVESDHDELINSPAYKTTFVYGNLLIEPNNDGNIQICHYGGDGTDQSIYRKGVLHFYNNTVISRRTGNTTLFRLSSNDEKSDARNNVVEVSAGGSSLAILDETGTAELRNNWLNTGWVGSHSTSSAAVQNISGNITGTDAKFKDTANANYTPADNSPLINAAGPLSSDAEVNYKPLFDPSMLARTAYKSIGAFEQALISVISEEFIQNEPTILTIPNPFLGATKIIVNATEGKIKITITDISGKLILQNDAYTNEENKFIFDWNASMENSGVYILKVETGDGSYCRKIVKT